MWILLAPCSFKGVLNSWDAARAMAKGVTAVQPRARTTCFPIADGGEGTMDVLAGHIAHDFLQASVLDARLRPLQAQLAFFPKRRAVYVESAAAIGLGTVADLQREAALTASDGLGMLIREALNYESEELWIGLGGSATVDGGAGMLRALGARLCDDNGQDLAPQAACLDGLARIDFSGLDPRLAQRRLKVLCDVRSPLLGPHGARLYMPQKGADPAMCERLEANLERLAHLLAEGTGRDLTVVRGGGAAGGIGAALAALDADLLPGARFVMEQTHFLRHLHDADLVLTGEGRLDAQTREGKAIAVLATVARQYRKPLVALCGGVPRSTYQVHQMGVTASFALATGPMSLRESREQTALNLSRAAGEVAAIFAAGKNAGKYGPSKGKKL